MSTAGQSRDPALQAPSWMYPWRERQPEGPGNAVTLDEVLEMPVLPGPVSNSGALSWATDTSVISEPVLNGSYSEPQLAKVLSWKT